MDRARMDLMLRIDKQFRGVVIDFLESNGFEKVGEDAAKLAQIEHLNRQKSDIEAKIAELEK